MPSLAQHQSASVTKALIMADSGTGKTGSLISLVEAGYNLRILDFDNGLDYLFNLIRQQCPDKLGSVIYVTLLDRFKTAAGRLLLDGAPKALTTGMTLLHDWKTDDEELGPAMGWGPQDVLVLDSLTFFDKAAMRSVLFLNGRPNGPTHQSDWLLKQNLVENILNLIAQLPCNVIVTSHVNYVLADEGAVLGAYPAVGGQKLPPVIARYFNAVLSIERKGSGKNEKRSILCRSKGFLELKASSPVVPAELPIATGLADYFNLVRESPDTKKE